MRSCVVSMAAWLAITAGAMAEGPAKGGLELRKMTPAGPEPAGWRIPHEAVRAFVYEGMPLGVRVTDKHIAADYEHSGVLFDRQSGKFARRFTVADGWPTQRPEPFRRQAEPGQSHGSRLIGPGVLNPFLYRAPDNRQDQIALQPAVELPFGGRTWRAMQPANLVALLERQALQAEPRRRSMTWSGILQRVNELSYLETTVADGTTAKRFTTADGLASNIITHLAASGDTLWAACVDIYDPQSKQWGPGGLCRYQPTTGRWEHVQQIDGRPVRWVTLLQAVNGDLWVGFREGKDVAGDEIAFGMGIYPGVYRPQATGLVLTRLSGGKWSTFSRKPRPDPDRSGPESPVPANQFPPPTEYPEQLAPAGSDSVMLFARARNPYELSGNWELPTTGLVSLLNPKTGRWRLFDTVVDLGADKLVELVAQSGEVLVRSSRGVHRFRPQSASETPPTTADTWEFLDPHCDLLNPSFHTAAVAGDELWLGYDRQSFSSMGTLGISRFSERTGRWSHMSPAELGTSSAVRRIVALSNGEVWVLFGERPVMSAAGPMFSPLDTRQSKAIPRRSGLGRFAGGKWQFPVEGPPLPDRNPPASFFVSSNDLAAVGDKLVYATGQAVYAGPKPWKRIVAGRVLGISPAEHGAAVEIICLASSPGPGEQQAYLRGLYRPGMGEVPMKDFRFDSSFEPAMYAEGHSLLREQYSPGRPRVTSVRLPGRPAEQWAVAEVGEGLLSAPGVLESPRAAWIFSYGEIIRLDRKALAPLPEKALPAQ